MINYEAILSSDEFAVHIKGCVLNKRDSQKEIYAAFYKPAMAICERYAATFNEAIEILNKGFLKIFKQLINCSPAITREMSSFPDWLLRVIEDEAIDHYRRNNMQHGMAELRNRIVPFPDSIKNRVEKLLPGDESMICPQ